MPSLSETHMENRFHVHPNQTNSHNTAHGGNVMKWIDEVGGMIAKRFARETVVTAKMGEIDFGTPVPLGGIVLIDAFVYETGRTSVKIWFDVYCERTQVREKDHVTSLRGVYVAVDDNGEPVPVPELTVETERDQELYDRVPAARKHSDT